MQHFLAQIRHVCSFHKICSFIVVVVVVVVVCLVFFGIVLDERLIRSQKFHKNSLSSDYFISDKNEN